MHSFRTDSQFFRNALERVGKSDDARSAGPSIPVGGERRETEQIGGGKAFVSERELEPMRVIGRLSAGMSSFWLNLPISTPCRLRNV